MRPDAGSSSSSHNSGAHRAPARERSGAQGPPRATEPGSGAEPRFENDNLLLVGRVARAHGNRGQVIVNLETDFPEAPYAVGQVLHVGVGGQVEPRRIESVRFHQGRPVIALEGVDSMNDAEALAGAELKIPAAELAPLPEGTFYHHDLVGCEVRDRSARVIGRVTGVEGTLERSRLVVEGPEGQDVLIPMVAEICVTVDPASRVIVIDPPEGLIDLNA